MKGWNDVPTESEKQEPSTDNTPKDDQPKQAEPKEQGQTFGRKGAERKK